MTLLVATRNRGKQAEFRELLAPLEEQLIFPDEIGIVESDDENGLESADTFVENARAKARWFAERSGLTTLADDSGLEVDSLNGAPGVHSKRFAGHSGADHLVTNANNVALLAALRGVPIQQRSARYRCVLVIVRPTGGREWHRALPVDGAEIVTEGTTEGRILDTPVGSAGFGYDPIFFSDDLELSFGQASSEAKHAVSHRGRAGALIDRVLASTTS